MARRTRLWTPAKRDAARVGLINARPSRSFLLRRQRPLRWFRRMPRRRTLRILCAASLAALRAAAAAPRSPLSSSKLSLHVGDVTGVDAAVEAFLAAARPRTLKLLDPRDGWAAAALRASPGTELVGRIWTPTQPTDGDPRAAAAAWLNASRATILASPEIRLWEGYNELPGTATNSTLMRWYADFEMERVRLLAALGGGLRAVVGSFATSDLEDLDPATSTFAAFVPAARAAAAAGGLLSLHEYSSPLMWTCFSNGTGVGRETGRYRTVYENFFVGAGLPPPPPLLLSEVGVGWASPACGGSGVVQGWRAYCAAWAAPGGAFPGEPCEDAYVAQLAWYDAMLRSDSYVVGANVFCQACGGFDSFDTAPALGALAAYMQRV